MQVAQHFDTLNWPADPSRTRLAKTLQKLLAIRWKAKHMSRDQEMTSTCGVSRDLSRLPGRYRLEYLDGPRAECWQNLKAPGSDQSLARETSPGLAVSVGLIE